MAPVELEVRYGGEPSQFGQLRLPAEQISPVPVVVLIHGGFWRAKYGLDLMEPLAADLDSRGYATWNIEYRRVGQAGGGYPGTLVDAAAAVDHLTELAPTWSLDLADVVFIGHSAGGHLALWAAGRGSSSADQPGAGPRVVPRLAVGLGPVVDLEGGDAAGLGGGAVTQFIGGPLAQFPDRYAIASPVVGGVKVVVVRGTEDDIVPARFTEPAGDQVELIDVPGDHFDLIDPTSRAWAAVTAVLGRDHPVPSAPD